MPERHCRIDITIDDPLHITALPVKPSMYDRLKNGGITNGRT